MIYLDTHVAVWLYAGLQDSLPAPARAAMEKGDLLVSPMVVLELQYLFEIGRIKVAADTLMSALGREIGLKVCDLPFEQIADSAIAESWTRDPFDRIIVGQARLRGARLVSKDRHIHDNYPQALWSAEVAGTTA